jgi:hypothetical protein
MTMRWLSSIWRFQAHNLRDAQANRVANGAYGAMFKAGDAIQKMQDLFRTQDHGQLCGFLGAIR